MNRSYSGLHRCALALAVLALIVIVSGAYITSTEVVAQQNQTAASGIDEMPHQVLSIALAVLALGAAIWTSFIANAARIRALAWTGFATLALDAALGLRGAPLSPALGIFHALLAHFFLSLVIVIAVISSAGWNREPELVDDAGWSFLRPLAVAAPPVVLVQIVLGSAYRHQAIGIMPHMAGAMVVALLTLIVSAVVLQNFSKPASMRNAAITLISIVLAQVCFGIAAFLMLVLNAAGTFAFLLVTVGHVTIGAAALAASVVMAMQVSRSIVPKAQQAAAPGSI